MNIDIIDDFLTDYQFKQIESSLMGDNFPWYYNNMMLSEDHSSYNPNHYQLTHNLLESDFSPLLSSFFNKLSLEVVYRVKCNMTPKTYFHRVNGYHTDWNDVSEIPSTAKVGIFYVNTNNGGTKIKKGPKVKSVANRMLIFDASLEHSGITCTNEKRRVVINFNYK